MNYMENGPSPAKNDDPLLGSLDGSGNPDSSGRSGAQVAVDLVKEISEWTLKASPAPLALAGTICGLATVGGIAGGSYNIDGRGLAGYFWLSAKSGTGKGSIKRCHDKLMHEASKLAPTLLNYLGPSYIASGPACLKNIAKRPYPNVIVMADEFAHDVKEMSNPRNTNAIIKDKVYCELWSLSGAHDVFNPMAYSDGEKNTQPLRSPNLTIVGTSTIQKAKEAITNGLARSGFIARFIVAAHAGDIPPLNEQHAHNLANPPVRLVTALADLATNVLTLQNQNKVHDIAIDGEAKVFLKQYATDIRNKRNAASDTASDLHGRDYEKTLKIAGTLAVGRNIINPIVTLELAKLASAFVNEHATSLVNMIDNGENGEEGGNQPLQVRECLRLCREYLSDSDKAMKYHPKRYDIWAAHIIPLSYLTIRMSALAVFSQDRLGAKASIVRTLKHLADDIGVLTEVPKLQMLKEWGVSTKAFTIGDAYAVAHGI